MSTHRYFGRVESAGLLHRDVVIRLEENVRFEVGQRVVVFEVAEQAEVIPLAYVDKGPKYAQEIRKT